MTNLQIGFYFALTIIALFTKSTFPWISVIWHLILVYDENSFNLIYI